MTGRPRHIVDRAKIARHNIIAMIVEGSFFWIGLAFLEINTVIPLFITSFTGSVVLAGLAVSLRSVLFLLGQVIMGMFIHKLRRQGPALRLLAISRVTILIMGLLMLAGLKGYSAVIAFLFLYGTYFFADGLLALIWIETNARTVPARDRGMVGNVQQIVGGSAGIFIGFVVRNILKSAWTLEQQFTIIFLLAGTVLMLDFVSMFAIKDVPHESEPDRPVPGPIAYFKGFAPLLRDSVFFRRVVACRFLFNLSFMAQAMYIVMGIQKGNLTIAQQGTLVIMPVIGQILGGVAWTFISRRWGYPPMMLSGMAMQTLCALISLVTLWIAGSGLPIMIPLCVILILMTANMPAHVGFTQHMMLNVDQRLRAQYIVLMALMITPATMAPMLAGIIINNFGFLPVFIAALAASGFGLYLVFDGFYRKRSAFYYEHGKPQPGDLFMD